MNAGISSSNINLAQIILQCMPINQEALLLISIPNSAIIVSQMQIPQKRFQRAVDGVKKFFGSHSSRMKVTSN